jgi:hypothetical protein
MRHAQTHCHLASMLLAIVASAAVAQPASSGKDTLESVIRGSAKVKAKAADIFASVKDKATAVEAVQKMSALGKEKKEVMAAAERLSPIDPEEVKRLWPKYKDEYERLAKRFNTESKRLHGIEGGKEVVQAFVDHVFSAHFEFDKKINVREEKK